MSRRWFLILAAAIFIAAFAAHSSSLRNQYAFDDELLIVRNVAVQRGIAGVGEIFTKHMFAGYFESVAGEASRANLHYRPIPVLTFAIEQSLLGRTLGDEYRAAITEFREGGPAAQQPRLHDVQEKVEQANRDIAFQRHAIQVFLYAASMVVLLFFLIYCVFPGSPAAAFVTTLLFALHPIHTEVVANLKSREEILSFLFIVLSGILVFEWDRTRKPVWLAAAMGVLALALLSKEYAVVAPLIFGAALVLVRGRDLREALKSTVLPLFVPVVAYLLLRRSILGSTPADVDTNDILIDPFLPLRTGEASGSILATKIAIVARYLRLLVYPRPLSSDYSYATFDFQSFGSAAVWISLALYLALAGLTIFAWRRRHILALAGIIFFAFLLLTQIGATMGERLAYHASLGFAMLLGWLIARCPKAVVAVVCILIAVPYGYASYRRDAVWKDNRTLFLTDVKTAPRSAMLNANAGGEILSEALDRLRERQRSKAALTPQDQAFVKQRAAEALVFLRRAVNVHGSFANAWINIGVAHYYREEWQQAGEAFARAASLTPDHPSLRQYAANFHMLGMALGKSGDLAGASAMLRRAAEASPQEPAFWRDYGAAAFNALQFSEARTAFEKMLKLDPQNQRAAAGFAAASAFYQLTRATEERPNDPVAFENLATQLARSPNPSFAAAAVRARATAAKLRAGA